jgi:hypothetical protein
MAPPWKPGRMRRDCTVTVDPDARASAPLGVWIPPVAALLFVLRLAVALYLVWDWLIGWAESGAELGLAGAGRDGRCCCCVGRDVRRRETPTRPSDTEAARS